MKPWIRRSLKIAGWAVLILLLVGTGLFTWMLFKPHAPSRIVEPGPSGRRVIEGPLFGNFYPAPGPARRPGILLLGGSEGGLNSDLHRQALLLQQGGYNVLHLGYFNVPGKSTKLERVPLEEFYRGLDWLKRHERVDPSSLAVVGYSKGAEAALIVATTYPGIKAVVAGMPSNVVWDALSMRSYIFGGISSFSRNGEDLPSLPYGPGDSTEHLLPRFTNALKRLDEHPQTIIPVERFAGRLLLICGEKDVLWPACPMARDVEARAGRAGRPDVQLLAYPAAGHGVMGAPLPAEHRVMKRWAELGGTAEANAKARADSWQRIMTFLSTTLSSQ